MLDLLSLAPVLALLGPALANSPEDPSQEHAVRRPLPSPEELAKLPSDGGEDWNRLVFEQSPYLLQHAANPVDWWPWGDAAFAAAREQDKPIFLSVGYSTCHWCHVMEHESFEDDEVAALLNEHFVCVKVDREERPDVDQAFMAVTQALTGRGGWPNTLCLTPAGKPFFAATYIPKDSRFGRRGLTELIPLLGDAWINRRQELEESAAQITERIGAQSTGAPGEAPGPKILQRAQTELAERFDAELGGFGTAPKFPIPHNLLFLLQRYERTGDASALTMVETTLRAMRRGGIWDHVGFGFHRYSTDQRWLVPHFEKMLYDQALLALAYTATWQVTGDDFYRQTADEIFTYILRDMTSPEGAFYSAEDADSEGEEGLFYLWTPAQVRTVLGDEAELFLDVYNIVEDGNFQDEASGKASGLNIPHLTRPLDELARERELEVSELAATLERARQKLFTAREARIHPLKDDKVLTDWNGLMIAAFARAGAAFGRTDYVDVAQRAADHVLATLVNDDGRLWKRSRGGKAGLMATLEDHAFLAFGLLELYQTSFEPRYLAASRDVTETMIAHFLDAEKGGFFIGADDGEELFVRSKEIYDGALPSGNSIAAGVLLRLAHMGLDTRYEALADGIVQAFAGNIQRMPSAHTMLLDALDFAFGPSFEVVVVGDPVADDTRAALAALQRPYRPHKVLLFKPASGSPELAQLAPFTADQTALDQKATLYLCRDFSCKAPTTDVALVLSQLSATAKDSDD